MRRALARAIPPGEYDQQGSIHAAPRARFKLRLLLPARPVPYTDSRSSAKQRRPARGCDGMSELRVHPRAKDNGGGRDEGCREEGQ